MKFKSEELTELLEVRQRIDNWVYEAFENQAENEEFQRKRTHKKYKKDIEKTRACILGVWWLDFKSIVNYKEPEAEFETVPSKKGLVGFFRRLFRLDKKKIAEIRYPTDAEVKQMIEQNIQENELKEDIVVGAEDKNNIPQSENKVSQQDERGAQDGEGA